ncbi:MAG: 4a-hydroxytetrahydrobiopterin dehydratase [Bacteroidetes bacterium]|nr:4a-hydroxytetrahydrobiopterin dehydratase [Bacteroidota bacterium]
MALLREDEIEVRMHSVPGWHRTGDVIRRTVILPDFIHAMGFVQSVALAAERADHHPDIDIRWNTVSLSLTTHRDGGLTEKDFSLALHINSIVPPQSKE